MQIQMGNAPMLIHMVEGAEKVLQPIGCAAISTQKVRNSYKIAFQSRVPELNEFTMRIGVSTYPPKERVTRKCVQVEETGSRTQEARLFHQERGRIVELAARIAE